MSSIPILYFLELLNRFSQIMTEFKSVDEVLFPLSNIRQNNIIAQIF